jgi:hypothetical protein
MSITKLINSKTKYIFKSLILDCRQVDSYLYFERLCRLIYFIDCDVHGVASWSCAQVLEGSFYQSNHVETVGDLSVQAIWALLSSWQGRRRNSSQEPVGVVEHERSQVICLEVVDLLSENVLPELDAKVLDHIKLSLVHVGLVLGNHVDDSSS